MVVIRLSRFGTNKRPFYRLVVLDKNKPRDGSHLEQVGHFEPLKKEKNFTLKWDRIQYWLKQGAQPSDTVRKLIKVQEKGGANT